MNQLLLITILTVGLLAHTASSFSMAGIHSASANLLNNVFSQTEHNLVLAPPTEKKGDATAIILIPGCQLQPEQYQDMARKIQDESDQPVWVSIPKVLGDAPNPLTVPSAVKNAMQQLKESGYTGSKAFVGGHSLGGVFLPTIVDEANGLDKDDILGFVRLGAFQQRSEESVTVPQLTLCGNLDGMVRTSRIAEDFQRNVLQKGDSKETRLEHSTVLVQGMNHFAFLSGKTPFMKKFRDLETELSQEQASTQVAGAIADFIDAHAGRSKAKATSLLDRIQQTQDYLQPMLNAMQLEGSYHVQEPTFEGEGKADATFELGCPWAEQAQDSIKPTGVEYSETNNEFHRVWFLNPLAEVPFYHPSVQKSADGKLELNTVSELVYETSDKLFDGGFFSNAPNEIRCKFNSAESILTAAGMETDNVQVPEHLASQLNAQTIEWALDQCPNEVRERYLQRGVQLKAGVDIEKTSGPGWIWTSLQFRSGVTEDGRPCKYLDSPTMKTALDHPIPHVGGKMYCKLLSPTKALDWIYTDSLRAEPNLVESIRTTFAPAAKLATEHTL